MKMRGVTLALAGVVVGALAGGVFVGRATAQQPYAPVAGARWQYMCQREFPKVWEQSGTNMLNGLGAQGWELAQQLPSNPDVFCFKRRY
jgi:hypothetical protein